MKNSCGQIKQAIGSIEEEQHQNENLKLRKSKSFKHDFSTYASICQIPKLENKNKLRRSLSADIFSHSTLLNKTLSEDKQVKCGLKEASTSIIQNRVFSQESKLISKRNFSMNPFIENFGHSRLSKLREKYLKIKGKDSYTFDWQNNRIPAS